jgi:predicted kinase
MPASFVRLDAVESGIVAAGLSTFESLGPAGYAVAHHIVRSCLGAGLHVVVDAVNPVRAAREAWRDLGRACGADALLVEVRCSDVNEHRRRVESRTADLPGHQVPSWNDLEGFHFEEWPDADLRADTALSANSAVDAILEALAKR